MGDIEGLVSLAGDRVFRIEIKEREGMRGRFGAVLCGVLPMSKRLV